MKSGLTVPHLSSSLIPVKGGLDHLGVSRNRLEEVEQFCQSLWKPSSLGK